MAPYRIEGVPPKSRVFAPLGLNSVQSVPDVEDAVKWIGKDAEKDNKTVGRMIEQFVIDSGYVRGVSQTGAIINERKLFNVLKPDDQVYFVTFKHCNLALITSMSQAMIEENAKAIKPHFPSFVIIAVVSSNVLKATFPKD